MAEEPVEDCPNLKSAEANKCMRCDTELTYLGPRAFHESMGLMVNTHIGDFFADNQLRVFYCPACGHVDLFMQR